MLNVSENDLQGDSCLDDEFVELRTLNISFNPKITRLRSHVAKCFGKLQALIATGCGLTATWISTILPRAQHTGPV